MPPVSQDVADAVSAQPSLLRYFQPVTEQAVSVSQAATLGPVQSINRRCRKCFFGTACCGASRKGRPPLVFRLSRNRRYSACDRSQYAANYSRNFARFSRIFGVSKKPNRMPPHPFPWAFTCQIPLKCFYEK